MEEIRAGIYARISDDTEGQQLGVSRQRDDCEALAAANGWIVDGVWIDNDIGASTRTRKKSRPEYSAMIEAVEAGRIDAIVAYSNSRLTRRPMELESIIRLHERTGVLLDTVVSGRDDLSTADGRMVARIKASVDAGEVERTAERVARKHLANARAGKPVGGTRPFGWHGDKVTPEPTEARLIQQAAADVLAGVPVRRVCDAWNEAGVTTSLGNPWKLPTMRQMLLSPRLAGWRVHQGEICIGTDGEPVRGQWEAILDDATHEALNARLKRADRRSRVPRRNSRHYLLTGVVRCGLCNGPMYGNRYAPDRHHYVCHDGDETGVAGKHTLSVSGVGLDGLVRDVVLARLARETFERPSVVFDRADELADVENRIKELMSAYNTRQLTGSVVFPAVSDLESQRDALIADKKAVEAAASDTTLAKVTPETFDGLNVDRQRAIVENLFEVVIVRRPATHSNHFDPERVELVWRR